MATVTVYTAERMKQIEDSCIVNGAVVIDNLHLTRHDGGVIDAGNVRGPTGSPGVTQAQLDSWMKDNLPVCTIVDYLGTAVPNAKWLPMINQRIIDGEHLYPDFWSKIPTTMKIGSDIQMPETRGRVTVGYDATQVEFNAIGAIGGEKQHILTKAELPNVAISVDPPATNVSVNPPSTPVAGNSGSSTITPHSHAPENSSGEMFIVQRPGGPHALYISAGTGVTVYTREQTSTVYMDYHMHDAGGYYVDIPPFNVNVDIPAFNSAPLGSGVGHNVLQSYVVMLKMVKVLP